MLTRTLTQATHKDGKEAGIELVNPPAGSKPGERIYFEGAEFESQYFVTIDTSWGIDVL